MRTQVKEITEVQDKLKVKMLSEEGEKDFEAEMLLAAVGRKLNMRNLDLEKPAFYDVLYQQVAGLRERAGD
jgi:pyruvate/2-oxoglutarate dehydrogenase complex dihydrolipoamide dehydrogenase (E3) component